MPRTSHIRKLRSNDSSAGFGEYVAPAEAFHWIGQLLLGLEHLGKHIEMAVNSCYEAKEAQCPLLQKGHFKRRRASLF